MAVRNFIWEIFQPRWPQEKLDAWERLLRHNNCFSVYSNLWVLHSVLFIWEAVALLSLVMVLSKSLTSLHLTGCLFFCIKELVLAYCIPGLQLVLYNLQYSAVYACSNFFKGRLDTPLFAIQMMSSNPETVFHMLWQVSSCGISSACYTRCQWYIFGNWEADKVQWLWDNRKRCICGFCFILDCPSPHLLPLLHYLEHNVGFLAFLDSLCPFVLLFYLSFPC